MKRRHFLEIGAAAFVSPLLPVNILSSNQNNSPVWEAKGLPGQSIPALFEALGGLKSLITKDIAQSTVLIKPNLCLPHGPELGTTSAPDVIEALCLFLESQGVKKIIIADHTLRQFRSIKNTALQEIISKHQQIKLILANEQRLYQPVQVAGKVLHNTEVLKMLSRVDLLINLATAKHHSATNVSLAIKNLMGLIWNRSIFHTDLDLPQAIADLALVIRPGLNIIDTSRVLLNGGPTGPGPIVKDNCLYAGFDILALDSVVVSRYNFGGKTMTAKEIPHLWSAYQNSIGKIDLQNINIYKVQA
jgi:uncharacterized protein (DUF362 family)